MYLLLSPPPPLTLHTINNTVFTLSIWKVRRSPQNPGLPFRTFSPITHNTCTTRTWTTRAHVLMPWMDRCMNTISRPATHSTFIVRCALGEVTAGASTVRSFFASFSGWETGREPRSTGSTRLTAEPGRKTCASTSFPRFHRF